MRANPTPECGDLAQDPFSNSDHGEWWLARNCRGECIHDTTYGLADEELGSTPVRHVRAGANVLTRQDAAVFVCLVLILAGLWAGVGLL